MWQIVNVTYCEFGADPRCDVGVLVEVAPYHEGGQPRRYLLGDVNLQGGVCDDCCELSGDDVILRVLDLRDTIAAAVTEAAS